MYAIKEAMIAKRVGGEEIDTVIFYMDMRTFGKSFQRYRDAAQIEHQIRFEHARAHSIASSLSTGDPVVRFVRMDGSVAEERFDMVVLSVGQRPTAASAELSESMEIPLNPWRFLETTPFTATQTQRPGVFIGGSFSGLKDISESVIYASAAAMDASGVIHKAGGSLALARSSEIVSRDLSREKPKVLVALCTCNNRFPDIFDAEKIAKTLKFDNAVSKVITIANVCTSEGWDTLTDTVKESHTNRLLIGACHPYIFTRQIKDLNRKSGMDSALIDIVDMKIYSHRANLHTEHAGKGKEGLAGQAPEAIESVSAFSEQISILRMALARLKLAQPTPCGQAPVCQEALVIGGGISGITAALAIADMGYPVHLIEQSDQLGGNLRWLDQTIEGQKIKPFLEEMIEKTEKHTLVQVHTKSKVMSSFGQVGQFFTVVEHCDAKPQTIEHGIVIIATGGHEAVPDTYAHGMHSAILTQKEFEKASVDGSIEPNKLNSVVFIQCVGSREAPRNYCSRICCISSLKHALSIKRENPDAQVFILYRDMMSYGFYEYYYTKAREQGVIFIPYEKENKPEVTLVDAGKESKSAIVVKALDPILRKT
jgi:heterodisulfide reductase subunit A